MTKLNQANELAQAIVSKVGKEVVLGVPLGAGKPNLLINALYEMAQKDPSLSLTILTALTLNKPSGSSLLERRFVQPFADRIFGDYPNLKYEEDRASGKLPKNVQVIEFYFQAGRQSKNVEAQCNYVSSNYTHVARDLVDYNINVVANMVAPDTSGETYSLSCNADIVTDVIDMLNAAGRPHLFCGQVNANLPYMYGDAVLTKDRFDYLLENEETNYPVFAPPKLSVPDVDHIIGFYASTLIQDGGELQVGIGSLGDSLVYCLLMRHQNNETYLNALEHFEITQRYNDLIARKGDTGLFHEGLFGATEMFVDGFMHLIEAGILKREVYDHVELQRLLNERLITKKVTPDTLYHLLERRAIAPKLQPRDFKFLQSYGIFKQNLAFKDGYLLTAEGERIEADLNEDSNFQQILKSCLGDYLRNGAVVHGGFFLGCNAFYQWLRDLPEEKRRKIHMKPVSKINQLYGHEALDRLHRKKARFVNTCMKMTLLGAAVSDGLEDGTVISGVGGQYNFVAMAHALPDGHSIIQLRSTREEKGEILSNIVFNYGHVTIPRHLRDIVITEYGIADVRGKTDSQVIAALIEIADSRFQEELIQQAKGYGKLHKSYQLPQSAKNNTPEYVAKKLAPLKSDGLFPKFPFGTELTDVEIQVGGALKALKKKQGNKAEMAKLLSKAALQISTPKHLLPALERMGLDQPKNFKERLYQKLLITELS